MTAYQLDHTDQLHGGGWAIPQPWAARLHRGQTIDLDISGRPTTARVTAVRTHYAIAHEIRP